MKDNTLLKLSLLAALLPAGAAAQDFRPLAGRTFAEALAAAGDALPEPGPAEKIVGGATASPGEFPFIVSLQSEGRHFCGGSLVSRNWVLTAHHCTPAVGGVVVIGAHNAYDAQGAERFTIAQVVNHPEGGRLHDYSLIRLSGESRFRPVALNRSELPEGTPLVTAGWGKTADGAALPALLQKVSVPLVSPGRCSAAYPGGINNFMVCAGLDQGGKDACQGDSGGPLVRVTGAGMALVGVVSWGEGCAKPGKYGVYAKVSAVAGWIDKTVGGAGSLPGAQPPAPAAQQPVQPQQPAQPQAPAPQQPAQPVQPQQPSGHPTVNCPANMPANSWWAGICGKP